MIRHAMNEIESNTCFSFRNYETAFNPRDVHRLKFVSTRNLDNKCYSSIGYDDFSATNNATKEQLIFIGERCMKRVGYLIHELFHALGVVHQQQRPDRNFYVNVNKSNIVSS